MIFLDLLNVLLQGSIMYFIIAVSVHKLKQEIKMLQNYVWLMLQYKVQRLVQNLNDNQKFCVVSE